MNEIPTELDKAIRLASEDLLISGVMPSEAYYFYLKVLQDPNLHDEDVRTHGYVYHLCVALDASPDEVHSYLMNLCPETYEGAPPRIEAIGFLRLPYTPFQDEVNAMLQRSELKEVN